MADTKTPAQMADTKTPAKPAAGNNQAATTAPKKTKADRFKEIGSQRLNNALKSLDLLANCAKTESYEYTDTQVRTIETLLVGKVEKVLTAFKTKKAAQAEKVQL